MGNRSYRRQYVVSWDSEVGRYHVTLGKDSIGFHRVLDGAKTLAASHATQMRLTIAHPAFEINVQGCQPSGVDPRVASFEEEPSLRRSPSCPSSDQVAK